MPGVHQPLSPASGRAVVCMGVVPMPRLMHITAASQRGSRRDTYWAIGIRVCETSPTFGKSVDIRRFDDRVAVTSCDFAAVLVRKDVESVLWLKEHIGVGTHFGYWKRLQRTLSE